MPATTIKAENPRPVAPRMARNAIRPPAPLELFVASSAAAAKGYTAGALLSLLPRLAALLGRTAVDAVRGKKKTVSGLASAIVNVVGKSLGADAAAFLAVLVGGIPLFEGLAAHLIRAILAIRRRLVAINAKDAGQEKAPGAAETLAPVAATFIATWLAAYLAVRQLSDRGRRTDLMLFTVVRAGDVLVRGMTRAPPKHGHHSHVSGRHHPKAVHLRDLALSNADTLTFVASCSVIMWCWFYEPRALPRSYNNWISRMSELSPSLHRALRYVREGRLQYGQDGPNNDLLFKVADDYGMPRHFGDVANFGPNNPHGFGQIPCLLVHKGLTHSCPMHWKNVWIAGFRRSILIYLPIHVIARFVALANRRGKAAAPIHYADMIARTARDVFMSTAFLSTFITLVWMPICILRSHVLPQGVADKHGWGPGLGSFLCGFSILLERKSRRKELALFVLPRAIYALGYLLLGKARLAEALKVGAGQKANVSPGGALKVWERILVDAVFWPAGMAVLVSCYRADRDFWYGTGSTWVKYVIGRLVGVGDKGGSGKITKPDNDESAGGLAEKGLSKGQESH